MSFARRIKSETCVAEANNVQRRVKYLTGVIGLDKVCDRQLARPRRAHTSDPDSTDQVRQR